FSYYTPTTTAYITLPLHDALPIWLHDRAIHLPAAPQPGRNRRVRHPQTPPEHERGVPYPGAKLADRVCGHDDGRPDHHRVLPDQDRKSTRLNSSHVAISYAVFCLK